MRGLWEWRVDDVEYVADGWAGYGKVVYNLFGVSGLQGPLSIEGPDAKGIETQALHHAQGDLLIVDRRPRCEGD
jgi:hypothetical protein